MLERTPPIAMKGLSDPPPWAPSSQNVPLTAALVHAACPMQGTEATHFLRDVTVPVHPLCCLDANSTFSAKHPGTPRPPAREDSPGPGTHDAPSCVLRSSSSALNDGFRLLPVLSAGPEVLKAQRQGPAPGGLRKSRRAAACGMRGRPQRPHAAPTPTRGHHVWLCQRFGVILILLLSRETHFASPLTPDNAGFQGRGWPPLDLTAGVW